MSLWSIETYITVSVPLLRILRIGSWSFQLITGYIAAPLRFPLVVGATMQMQRHRCNWQRTKKRASRKPRRYTTTFQRCLPQRGEGGRHRQNGVEEARKAGGKRLIRPLVRWCGWLVVHVGGNGQSTYYLAFGPFCASPFTH